MELQLLKPLVFLLASWLNWVSSRRLGALYKETNPPTQEIDCEGLRGAETNTSQGIVDILISAKEVIPKYLWSFA